MITTRLLYRVAYNAPILDMEVEIFERNFVCVLGDVIPMDWLKMGFFKGNYINSENVDSLQKSDLYGLMQSKPDLLMALEINKVGAIGWTTSTYGYYKRIDNNSSWCTTSPYGECDPLLRTKLEYKRIGKVRTVPKTNQFTCYINDMYVYSTDKETHTYVTGNGCSYLTKKPMSEFGDFDSCGLTVSAVKLAAEERDIVGYAVLDDNKLYKGKIEEDLKWYLI